MNISDPYDGFSQIFDKVVSVRKYDKWEKWIKGVWLKHGFAPKSLLDLACGTGINSIRFANFGIKVFGVDSSAEMLNMARKKNSEVNFIQGHFLNFSLSKKVDAAICLDFSTNYILRHNDFVEFLNRVYKSLNDGGVFIFDIKPIKAFPKKEKHIKDEDFTFDWNCSIENSPFAIIDMNIVLNDNKHFFERHVERGYVIDEIKEIISLTKFELLEIYNDCGSRPLNDEAELIQFVLKK